MRAALLLLFPDQDFPPQMRQGFDTAALETRNDVGNRRRRNEGAEKPFARMPHEPGEIMQAFGRSEKHASQSVSFDHLPKPAEAALPLLIGYAGYGVLPRHFVFLLLLRG